MEVIHIGMAKTLKQVVIDVLKPHEPSITEISSSVVKLTGVKGLNTSVYDVDKNVEHVKMTIEGDDIPVNKIIKMVEDMGATIHGIDSVSYGEVIVKELLTSRDWTTRV